MEQGQLVVDTHVHPISTDTVRYPLRSGSRGPGGVAEGRRAGEGGMVEKGMTTEQMLDVMEAADVRKAVLVQSASLYGFDNDYIADSAQAHPDRCIALCAIDVLADDAPDVLSRWVNERGMRGIRFTAADSLDDPKTFGVWERAGALGVPMDVQLRLQHFDKLREALARFREIPVLIDHAGNANRRAADGTPPPAEPPEALLSLAAFPNLYLKLTTQNLDGVLETGAPPEAFFGPLLARFGAGRLMWGTDFPATANQPYGERLAQSKAAFAFMSASDQALVMGGTALAIWPELGD